MLTLKQTKQHYLRPEVRNTILRLCTDSDTSRSGHWQDTEELNGETIDKADWYRHVNGKKYKYNMSSPIDYTNMVLKHRTIYWTLNFFDKGIFKLDYSAIATNESPVISQKYTVGYSLGIDIDKGHGTNIHDPDVKKAVEDMGQFFSDFLREYLPNSVYCLYSGGGVYLLIHHKSLQQYYDRYLNSADPVYTWEYMFQVLGNAFDMLIESKEKEFFKLHPDHVGKVKADALNNSQRVFKTIYSIHKKLDYAVIPLDPENIIIDFEKAKIPLKNDVLEDGLNWYKNFDDGGYFLVNCLKPYLEEAIKKKKSITYDSEYRCSSVPLDDIKKWPPCMRNILTLETREDGATRALAGFASFLRQIGIPETQAREMFFSVANRWGTRTSNIFESYYGGKMKTPTCSRLCSDDNTKFPKGVSIKKLGVCVPDQRCLNSPSPYYYMDKKAKLRW